MPSKDELKILQALPLEVKIAKTKQRIREWVNYYGTNGVYVSFSGGKDSTVLLHIVRQMYPDIEAVFVDTGLEFPQLRQFVKTFDNVTILRPKMRFDEVIKKHGYPFIGKTVAHNVSILRNCPNGKVAKNVFNPNKKGKYAMHKWKPLATVDFLVSEKCCDVMKKEPAYEFQEKTGKLPILATMADESEARKDSWVHNGCNAFNIKNPHSAPLSFWTGQDVLQYIKEEQITFDIRLHEANNATKSIRKFARKWLKVRNYKKIEIASVYGDIVYGEKEGEQYENTLCDCGKKLSCTKENRTGCIFCCFGANNEDGEGRFERLKKTHPRQYEYCMGGGAYDTDGLWKPTKEGLGMAHCIDELNKIYGKDFIKY